MGVAADRGSLHWALEGVLGRTGQIGVRAEKSESACHVELHQYTKRLLPAQCWRWGLWRPLVWFPRVQNSHWLLRAGLSSVAAKLPKYRKRHQSNREGAEEKH